MAHTALVLKAQTTVASWLLKSEKGADAGGPSWSLSRVSSLLLLGEVQLTRGHVSSMWEEEEEGEEAD